MHGLAPPYLSDDGLLVAEVGRRLRSADARTCVVPRTRTQFGDNSFAVAGFTADSFRKLLKTNLFIGSCGA